MPGSNWATGWRAPTAVTASPPRCASAGQAARTESIPPAERVRSVAAAPARAHHAAAAGPHSAAARAHAGAAVCRRHVGQGLALRPGAFLHFLVVLQAEVVALLLGFRGTHARLVFAALPRGHEFRSVDALLFLLLHLRLRLLARLCLGRD